GIELNSFGTIALLGGIVRSLRRRERVLANLLVGAGVLVVASSGALTRLGDGYGGGLVAMSAALRLFCDACGAVLVTQLAVLWMIYAGFELASQRAPSRRAAAHS